jgi:hypothetical protein
MKRRARQREFGFMGWGGKRRGAGRKPAGERAGVSHAKRPKLAARYPVLVTMRFCGGLASLRADDTHELVKRSFVAAESADFHVIEYSVQSNQCVQERLTCSAGDRPAGARARDPVAWMASGSESDCSKPIDESLRKGDERVLGP